MGPAPPLWELDLRFGDAGHPPVPGSRPEIHLRSTSASREFRSRWPPSAGAPKGEDRLTIVWHGQTLLFPRVPPVWRARALRRPDGAVQQSVPLNAARPNARRLTPARPPKVSSCDTAIVSSW